MDKKKLSFKDIMINYGVIIIVVLLVGTRVRWRARSRTA